MKKTLIAITCFFGAVCSTAFAENNDWYAEAAYGVNNVTPSDSVSKYTPGIARLTVGKVVAENWAIEGLLTQGITSSTAAYSSTYDVKIQSNTGYGFAVRPFIKVTDDLELYGRVGWMQNNTTVTAYLASSGATV